MSFFDRAAKYTLIFIGFLIPLSTAGVNIGFGVLLLFFLLSGHYQQKWHIIAYNPVVIAFFFLFVLLSIGTLYSTVQVSDAIAVWMKYRKLLWIAVLIPFLQDPKWRRWALAAFLIGMLVTLFLSYGTALHAWIRHIPFDNAVVFKNHITQNFLMAFTAYLLLQMSLHTPRPVWRWLARIGAILAICNILLFVQGRTGYIVLILLLVLAALQNFGWRGIVTSIASIALLLSLVFFISPTFHQRILHTMHEVQTYKTTNAVTSAGLRLEFYKNTLQIIQKNPLIGQGTGSLESHYTSLTTGQAGASNVKTANPHNEYLMLTAQIGLIGLLAFLYLLFQLWKQSYQLPRFERYIAQGMVTAFATGCMLNSLLLDFTEGHWFVYCAALLYAHCRPLASIPKQQSS